MLNDVNSIPDNLEFELRDLLRTIIYAAISMEETTEDTLDDGDSITFTHSQAAKRQVQVYKGDPKVLCMDDVTVTLTDSTTTTITNTSGATLLDVLVNVIIF